MTTPGLALLGVLIAAQVGPPGQPERRRAPQPDPATPQELLWQNLEADVARADRDLDGVMGIAILDLGDGRALFHNADTVFPAASSIKIAVLAELYRQAQEAAGGVAGRATLTDLYTADARDLVPGSDILAGLTSGVTRVTNRDLATFMIAVSDNAATNVLIERLGMAAINARLEELGLEKTRLRRKMMDLQAAAEGRENTSTPREMVALLAALHRGDLLDPARTRDLFQVLATRKDSDIPRDLPDDVVVANKPGWLEGVRTDSGIVFATHRPFAIAVMTSYVADTRAARDAISRLALAAFRYFDRVGRSSAHGRIVSPR